MKKAFYAKKRKAWTNNNMYEAELYALKNGKALKNKQIGISG